MSETRDVRVVAAVRSEMVYYTMNKFPVGTKETDGLLYYYSCR